MKKRLGLFLFVFVAMNLVFVPLLSLYGLRVCPVLSIPGFRFGCYYTAAFIFIAGLTNFLFIIFVSSENRRFLPFFAFKRKNRIWIYTGAYLAGTAISLGLLQLLLHLNHLSSRSRAPEILALASLLLGITQAYGLNWALGTTESADEPNPSSSFMKQWISHVARMMFPVAVVCAVLLHFLLSQSVGFNEGSIAPMATHDDFIAQTSYVISFLLAWLVLTFLFHFLSERDHVKRIQTHLSHLQSLDFPFRSPLGEAWGLWAAIIDQLNAFSQILGERTRLLKTFTRFVTASVAKEALKAEIKETTGVARELTVIMSDIRNFTRLSESLSPNQVVMLLNEYFSAMLDVATHYKVSVDKFIGDGLLAYVESELAESASLPLTENRLGVEAALAMIEKLGILNQKLISLGLPELKIGIGIFRGPLVIGLIGSETKLQHTIIGDTVNRTARLESLCKELNVSIVISGRVWHSLEEHTKGKFRSFGKQPVKGIAEPIEVFGGPV